MSSKKFSELGCLSPETLSVLKEKGFKRATPVQEATIPLFLSHRDCAVDACTGSGKTLAFALPVVEMMRRLDEPLRKYQASFGSGERRSQPPGVRAAPLLGCKRSTHFQTGLQVGAIIISPTRELAKQIYDVAEPFFSTVPGLTSMLLTGGTDPKVDVDRLMETGAHVLVRQGSEYKASSPFLPLRSSWGTTSPRTRPRSGLRAGSTTS